MIKKKLKIINKLGLHARAAAKFVAATSRYSCDVEITNNQHSVNGKSIMGVMMLAASKGTELEVTADGDDERAMMNALETLVNDRFGEAE